MTFIEFCEAHGLIIDRPFKPGKWGRYRTKTHPRKRNAAAKLDGDIGFVIDFSVGTKAEIWRSDKPQIVNPVVLRETIKRNDEERRLAQEKAAMRASMIISKCVTGRHEYLRRKGFPDEKGLIWCHDGTEHLIVPMRDELEQLVGLQTIDSDGNKRFLYGQKTRGANFMMGRGGKHILCEGYATGLSVRDAMRALKQNVSVHVCFSAGNLVEVSKRLNPGLVVADNDASRTGEIKAKETGWAYWISDREGEDYNDYMRRVGMRAASDALFRSLYPVRREVCSVDSLAGAIGARKLIHEGHS